MSTALEGLRLEVDRTPENVVNIRNKFLAAGYLEDPDVPNDIARGHAFAHLLQDQPKHLYTNDCIAGSLRGILADKDTVGCFEQADRVVESFSERSFSMNSDHFAPDYEGFLKLGIPGVMEKIENSLIDHQDGCDKYTFLQSMKICVSAFRKYVLGYANAAKAVNKTDISEICTFIADHPPKTFRQALQLIWLAHVAFCCEGRRAMAFGRMDQYLFSFYEADIKAGRLTRDEALQLVECTLYKIREVWYFGGDDVVNIAIGGVKREDGSDATNELSFLLLEAVKNCNIPGPNLSARLHKNTSERFLDACLQVIGTGLGYPALMNDEINIPALQRFGYSEEDCRDYCMVGCIENFIAGKQPPWSDGRFNSPKYIELALNNGVCMMTGEQLGPQTGYVDEMDSMEDVLTAVEAQLRFGAATYMMLFRNTNDRVRRAAYRQPFLSCFCRDCIERGLDINEGGTQYPSAHGAACMGIATFADSLAAIEQVVFIEKTVTLSQLCDALKHNFVGYEDLQNRLLQVPKYGNNHDLPDKYAVWFVELHNRLFSAYQTPDGGPIYIAIAANISNIPAGAEIAATPDGRRCGEPLSDAASPMHGQDISGPTAVVLSVTKPDYQLAACGTVINQKYSFDMFREPSKRAKLAALIRTYFQRGGQEIQINSVSRSILQDAIEHPENYGNLVVRVSGFSAFYTLLDREVQEDILKRTEHG